MGRPKEEVRKLLDTLPEEASFEDIHYHIYVQQAIRRGLEAAERGDLVDQDEIERRMSKWRPLAWEVHTIGGVLRRAESGVPDPLRLDVWLADTNGCT